MKLRTRTAIITNQKANTPQRDSIDGEKQRKSADSKSRYAPRHAFDWRWDEIRPLILACDELPDEFRQRLCSEGDAAVAIREKEV